MKGKNLIKVFSIFIIVIIIGQIIISNVYSKNVLITSEEKAENWVVLICGGVRNDTRELDKVQRNTTIKAYNTFKNLGYDDEHIYFLQLRNTSDPNEDKPSGVDCFSNKSNAKYAITNWLAEKSDKTDNCFILLIDHGNLHLNTFGGIFWFYDKTLDKQEYLLSVELSEWLSKIEYKICTILIDACYSGGFIKHISKENRIVMTSTSLTKGIASESGDFSSFFFDKLAENVSYGKAWEYAGKKHLQIKIRDLPEETSFFTKILAKILIFFQSPQIDDNGDAKGSGRKFIADKLPVRKDGNLALSTYPA